MTIAPGPATRSSVNTQVAAEIRAEMGRQNVVNAELARRLEVSEAWTTRRLGKKADTPLNLVDLQRIAYALGVPLATFLTPEIRETVPPAIAHYFGPTERTSDQRQGPRDNRPTGHPVSAASTGATRTAYVRRGTGPKRGR